jgi:predicted  nucleic acid-binding Zn-ribbon protein
VLSTSKQFLDTGCGKSRKVLYWRYLRKEIEMEMNEIKERIAEVQELITELHGDRQKLILDFGINLGITSKNGINLTELGEWAREVIDLNAEMAELANERKALRALKKELNPCVCACH